MSMTLQHNFPTIPTSLSPAARPASPHHSPNPTRGCILLVDDDAAVRDALTDVLQAENYEVMAAADGQAAVALFINAKPDLVLLDLNLPGPDGWKVLTAMEKRRPLTPVIVITARPHQEARAAGAGVDAIMEKPLDFPRLLEAIERLRSETDAQRLARLTRSGFKPLNLSRNPSEQPGFPSALHRCASNE